MTDDWRTYLIRSIRDSDAFGKVKEDKEFLHWLGGFIDGEGNFFLDYVPKESVLLMFTLVNTNLEIIKYVYKKLGLGKIYLISVKKPNRKPFARLQITRQKELEGFLTLILPYLRVKQLDARRMLEFIKKWRNAYGEKARQEVKKEFKLIE